MTRITLTSLALAIMVACLASHLPGAASMRSPGSSSTATLTAPHHRMSNIISPSHTPDPAVVFHEGFYYAVRSKIEVSPTNTDPDGWNCWHGAQDQVIINRARHLEDVFTSPEASVAVIDRSSPFGGGWGGVSVGAYEVSYTPGDGCPSPGFWAPALRHIDGRWFLFVTGHRPDFPGESNFVLENVGGDIMDVDGWVYRGMMDHRPPGLDGEPIVLPTNDPKAATVTLRDNGKTINGQLYYVYSHNVANFHGSQALNLVRLQWDNSTFEEFDTDRNEMMTYTRAFSLTGEAAITFPYFDWEMKGCQGCLFAVNEGPTALYGPRATYILFSASFCSTKYYAIGMLEFLGVGDGFPYLWSKYPRPVFSGDVFVGDEVVGVRPDAFGIGHNQVTTSPDLSEPWIVYHAKWSEEDGPADREARVQKFSWNIDGTPNFGNGPAGRGALLTPPSEAHTYAVLCSEPDFKGRFCVGLLPGRYSVEGLRMKGIVASEVRSIKVHGGALVKVLTAPSTLSGGKNENKENELLWSVEDDVQILPGDVEGAIMEVEVLAAVSAV